MELRIKSILAVFIVISSVSIAEAAWQGPTEVISGTWGANNEQFGIEYGDTNDVFGGPFYITLDGKLIVTDLENGRRKVYGANGALLKVIKCVKSSAGEWNEECRIPLADYIQTTSDGNIWVGPIEYMKGEGFSLYSPSGDLVKASIARPLKLGLAKEEVLDVGRYKTTITYDDGIYIIISDKQYEFYSRDGEKKLYEMLPGLVDQFSPCGKRLGRLLLPEDVVFEGTKVAGKEQSILIHAQYGSPVVDINGNVYVWKKTLSKYSILKWTWVDDLSDPPSGPDAPPGLSVMTSTTGLYLTWPASPQDPGCVTGYEIARATSAGGVYSTLTTVDKGVVKHNDTTSTAGTTYYYKLRAVAGSEYSPYTNPVSGKK